MLSYLSLLPGISASAGAISSSLQRRLLLYLIRRALGRFVQDGDLQLDQIEAGIGSGHVEIRNVRLDTRAIAEHLQHLPIRITHGTVASIVIDVPWTNLWAGTLSIKVVGIKIGLALAPPVASKDPSSASSLQDSIYTVAEEILEQDEEGRKLEQSITEEAGATQEAVAPSSIAARIVSGLLARLKVSLHDVDINLIEQDPNKALILRLADVTVHDCEGSSINSMEDDVVARKLELSGASLWYESKQDEEDAEDDEDDSNSESVYMNASTANLRDSAAASFFSSGASMYASAIASKHNDRDEGAAEASATRLASIEDIVTLQLTTGASTRATALNVDVDIGHIYAVLTPEAMSHLLGLVETFKSLVSSHRPSDNDAVPAPTTMQSLNMNASIRSLQLFFIYQLSRNLDEESRKRAIQSLDTFWARPSKSRPSLGHVRLRMVSTKIAVSAHGQEKTTDIAIGDMSLFESLPIAVGHSEAGEHCPILVLDPNLDHVAKEDANRDTFTDILDWRGLDPLKAADKPKAGLYRRLDASEYGWKVKNSHRRSASSMSGSSSSDNASAIQISMSSGTVNEVHFAAVPLHFFADLSLADRLMPMLKHLSRRTQPHAMSASTYSDMTASLETVQAPASMQSSLFEEPQLTSSLWIDCPLIRAEVRVPSDHSSIGRTAGLALRSGIVVAEVCGLSLRHAPAAVPSSADSEILFESVNLFFCSVKSTKAQMFAAVSHLASDEGDIPRLPRVRLVPSNAAASKLNSKDHPQSTYDCRLPSIQATLTKPLLDGLELVIDDAQMWLSALRKGEDDQDLNSTPDALKMLGSRFFGSKYSTMSGSSASTELVRRPERMPLVAVLLDEVRLVLIIPDRKAPLVSSTRGKRLELTLADIRIDINSQQDLHFSKASLSVAAMRLTHVAAQGERHELIERTLMPSLVQGAQSVITLHFTSTRDPYSSFQSSQIELVVQNLTLTYDGDASLVRDLIVFGRSPEGAFENVEPTEQTNISLKFKDISLLIAPVDTTARAVAALGELSLRAAIVSHHPKTSLKLRLGDSHIYATEKMDTPDEGKRTRCRRPEELWRSYGMWQLVEAQELAVNVLLSQYTRPETEVRVTRVALGLNACADSMSCLEEVIAGVKRAKVAKPSQPDNITVQDDPLGMFDSLDEDAFRAAASSIHDTDLLEDDIPAHPNYWGPAEREDSKSSLAQAAEEEDAIFGLGSVADTNAEHQAPPAMSDGILLKTDVVTVRLLNPNVPINPTIGYFADPSLVLDKQDALPAYASSLRVTVRHCDIDLRLFGGYDNLTTQASLQEEARRVRRRLQKIKQMLDKGQQPDDSVEEATAAMMGSMYLPVPVDTELDAAGMMQLMDDELGEQSETASSASTWKQFVPTAGAFQKAAPNPPKKRRSKLARSKESMIDFEFRGIKLDYDRYAEGSPQSARTLATVRTIRILDNIKTSTWHTFLTSIATDHNPLPQYSRDMLKVELHDFADNEVRVKAKLTPLRLHVDQDALDFLKKFFTFEQPKRKGDAADADSVKSPATPRPQAIPFIQHAEMYPIKLKLDYKPKRVDYRLLREGKTIEMMNFFNFEASDITLRHITLRGISGWPRLFELLNDLWTPDVKSNQLADVLSGIAPIRSLVNVGNGVADLILLPIEQYQRDGRLGKGLRDGATSFVKSTVLEAARIGARLATGTQVVLEHAEHFFGGQDLSKSVVVEDRGQDAITTRRSARDSRDRIESAESSSTDEYEPTGEEGTRARYSRYANQPEDMRQALDDAQRGLSRGFNQAAQTILAVPMEVYDRRSGEGAGMPVVRAVPIAVLKGAAGATEAITKALQGVQRELGGIDWAEREEKYKRPDVIRRSSQQGSASSTSTPGRR